MVKGSWWMRGLGGRGDSQLLEMFHEHLQADVVSQHHAATFLTHPHTSLAVS